MTTIERIEKTILPLLFFLIASIMLPNHAYPTMRTFPAGSWVIPMDPCWQPNGDGAKQPTGPNCDPDVNDAGVFQAYGMVYAILDRGDDPDNCINNDGSKPFQKKVLGYCKPIKVYWMIDKDKTSPHTPDLTISGTTTPIAEVFNSGGLTTTGGENPVNYVGGPFVIDANDITDTEMALFMSTYSEAKVHKIKVEFSGNVDKVLIGKPPKVAVLSEGAVDVLRDYLRASGLFSWENYVFEQLNARDVIAGCLQDPIPASCNARRIAEGAHQISSPFQLMWAPHWIVESGWVDGNPTLDEQHQVINEIRSFLERGNAGFYECASIESLEGSQDNRGPRAGNDYDQPNDPTNPNIGGFLVGRDNNPPRLDANGGCSDTRGCNPAVNDPTDSYLKFEETPFWLVQCGGWNYDATGGHVHNMRPNESKSYTYLTTKTTDDPGTTKDDRFVTSLFARFIHDDPDEVDYTPSSPYYVYDYLVGGRINGSPTQGYVIYFPGHKYIKCSETGSPTSPETVIGLEFDSPLDPGTRVYVEVVHPYCAPGTCPKVYFDIDTQSGSSDVDPYSYLDADGAHYDPATNTIKDIFLGNKTAGNLTINDIIVSFDTDVLGNPVNATVRLSNIMELRTTPPAVLCSPNSFSPAACTGAGISTNNMSLTFDGDISTDPSSHIVRIEVLHSACTEGIDCPEVVYDLSTHTQVSSRPDGNNSIYLDASMANYIYDPVTTKGTLNNIKIGNIDAGCVDVDITDVVVDFPDNTATTLLTSIDNVSRGENICTPNTSSQARCTSVVAPPPVAPVCPEAIFDMNTDTGNRVDDGVIEIDMTGASFDGRGKKLDHIKVKNIGCDKLHITGLNIEFPDDGGSLDKFKKAKSGHDTLCDPNPDINDSPASCSVIPPYTVGRRGDSKDIKLEFSHERRRTGAVKLSVEYTCDDGSHCGSGGPGGPSFSYTLPSDPTCGVGFGLVLAPFTSTCTIDWGKSNTCGIKYVLNTLLALRFQLTSSEFVKTQPIVKDEILQKDTEGNPALIRNVIYKSSFDYPIYRGHLIKLTRLINISSGTIGSLTEKWDAADHIPPAGISGFPSSPSTGLSARYIFTNLPGTTTIKTFDPNNASTLMAYLDQPTVDKAKVLINTIRGRKDAGEGDVHGSTSTCDYTPDGIPDINGCGEMSKKLWAIEHSTPALMTDSKLVTPADEGSTGTGGKRDMVIFAGADDGMLHAFHAGSWDTGTNHYDLGTGEEIWAYIPGSLLSSLQDQPFEPDPLDYSTFEPAVSVDGSPALGDFLVKNTGQCSDATVDYCWRTYLVGTAEVRTSSHSSLPNGAGTIFALDVTNPYSPSLLWEGHYADTSDSQCQGIEKNCNMGASKGVAIGSVFIGDELKSLVFLVSNWIEKKKPSNWNFDCTANPDDTECVEGISAYALDLLTGDVYWETRLPYTGDAVNVTDVPAIPALMDVDDNGTFDYLVFGDMQGRIWALNTVNGKSLAGQTSSGLEKPVFEVPDVTCSGDSCTAGSTPQGAKEPIGAPVSVSNNLVFFGTGGTDFASNTRSYHIFGLRIVSTPISGNYAVIHKVQDTSTDSLKPFIYETEPGEKVWTKPLVLGNNYLLIASEKEYHTRAANPDVSQLKSEGRIGLLSLKTTETTILKNEEGAEWTEGGFVGGFDADSNHAYTISLRGTVYSIGGSTAASFTPAADRDNPFDILWWRKL